MPEMRIDLYALAVMVMVFIVVVAGFVVTDLHMSRYHSKIIASSSPPAPVLADPGLSPQATAYDLQQDAALAELAQTTLRKKK